MPLQTFNFAQQQAPDWSGLGNLFQNYYKGRELAQTPQRLEREQRMQQLQEHILGAQAQYLPQQYEREQQAAQQELEYAPTRRQLEEEHKRAQTEQALASAYKSRQEAKNPLAHLTPMQKELSDIYGYGTPEYLNALKATKGIDIPGIPEGRIPIKSLGVNEQYNTRKEMRTELKRAGEVSKAMNSLTEMQKIANQYPDMADWISTSLVDPGKSGVMQQIKRIGIDKKKLAAIEKFDKLSADLVLTMGNALGGKNFTDAKLAAIEMSKPRSKNTSEANLYVINHLLDEFKPWKSYGSELQKGLEKGYVVEPVVEQYRNMQQEPQNLGQQLHSAFQQNNASQGGGESQTGITPDGRRVRVPADRMEEFLSKGGKRG